MYLSPTPFAISALLALLVATSAGRADAADAARDVPDAQPADSGVAASPELDADLVYAVLVGQVAAQRGDAEMAFTHFLQAAEVARNRQLAEAATRAALQLGEDQRIEQALSTWLEIEPESLQAFQFAALRRLDAGDVDGALVYLRRVVELAAERGESAYIDAARLVQRLDDPSEQLRVMRTLTDEAPANADAWLATAVIAAAAEETAVAEEAALKAAELRPDWKEPQLFVVRLLIRTGDNERAIEVLEDFVAARPEDQALRTLYAQLLVDAGEYERATEAFEVVLADRPEDADTLFALGVLSLQHEDLDAARGYFDRLWMTGERPDEAAYYAGRVEEFADKPNEAVTWYERVEGEQALDAKVRIARIRADQGDVDQAREILHRLREQWPDNAVTLYLIEADMFAEHDQSELALEVYDAGLRAYPDDPDLLYSRALHAVTLGRIDILEQDLRAVLEGDPDHADALNALGYTLADRTERLDEARVLIERALELQPEDPAILDSKGWLLYRLGDPNGALSYLERAFEMMPDGEIAAHLGEVLWELGRQEEAWRVWDGALEVDPEHKYLLQTIGRYRVSQSDTE